MYLGTRLSYPFWGLIQGAREDSAWDSTAAEISVLKDRWLSVMLSCHNQCEPMGGDEDMQPKETLHCVWGCVWYPYHNRTCNELWCEISLRRARETTAAPEKPLLRGLSIWWLLPESCKHSELSWAFLGFDPLSACVNVDQLLPPSVLPGVVPKQKHACYKFPVPLWQCVYWLFHFPFLDFVSSHLLSFFRFPRGSTYVLRLKTEVCSGRLLVCCQTVFSI